MYSVIQSIHFQYTFTGVRTHVSHVFFEETPSRSELILDGLKDDGKLSCPNFRRETTSSVWSRVAQWNHPPNHPPNHPLLSVLVICDMVVRWLDLLSKDHQFNSCPGRLWCKYQNFPFFPACSSKHPLLVRELFNAERTDYAVCDVTSEADSLLVCERGRLI